MFYYTAAGHFSQPIATHIKVTKFMGAGWHLVFGLVLVAIGLAWIYKRNVPIGIEGKPPSFHASGVWAIGLGIAAIAFGLVVAFDVPRHIRVDSCLDAGGKSDYEKECLRSVTWHDERQRR